MPRRMAFKSDDSFLEKIVVSVKLNGVATLDWRMKTSWLL